MNRNLKCSSISQANIMSRFNPHNPIFFEDFGASCKARVTMKIFNPRILFLTWCHQHYYIAIVSEVCKVLLIADNCYHKISQPQQIFDTTDQMQCGRCCCCCLLLLSTSPRVQLTINNLRRQCRPMFAAYSLCLGFLRSYIIVRLPSSQAGGRNIMMAEYSVIVSIAQRISICQKTNYFICQ